MEGSTQTPYKEVFDLAKEYSEREGEGYYGYHAKALDLIAGGYYFRFEDPPPPDAREIVENILEKYDYTIRTSGLGDVDDASVEAVVRASVAAGVAGNKDAFEWGMEMLSRMLRRVAKDVQAGNYASLIAKDVEVIAAGMQELGQYSQPYLEEAASSKS